MARSDPLQNKLVVLTGGSGFLGRYVAQALLQRGARVRIASRRPETAFSLKPLANLGQLQFARCDLHNADSTAAVVRDANAVVNLVGTFGDDALALMGSAAGRLAQAARDAGATAFVQISAIGADPASETAYAKGKALGESEVRDAFPKATILRPSIVFGEDDTFLNMFAGLIRIMPILPVFGPDAKLQLVHADDVAEAVTVALGDPAKHGGKTYELGGPEALTMMQINERIAAAQGRSRTFLPVPDKLSGIFAAIPGTPMSADQWTLLQQGSTVAAEARGFKQLGITPRPLSLFLDKWMTRYRRQGRFTAPNRMTSSAPAFAANPRPEKVLAKPEKQD